jgi:hypothetical protein
MSKLNFWAQATAPGLSIQCLLDDQTIFSGEITAVAQEIQCEFLDDPSEHRFEIVMTGKRDQHTTVSEAGEIVRDTVIEIRDFALDGILLKDVLSKHALYQHNQNDHFPESITEPFYRIMGCNGTVTFRFTTPTYLWLLENM